MRDALAALRRGASGGLASIDAIRSATAAAAASHEASFEAEARASGMLVSDASVTAVRVAAGLAGLFLFAVSMIRVAVRSEIYGSNAPMPAFLVMATVVVGIVALIMAFASVDSAAKTEYLAWLDDATGSSAAT